jgi:hypothetical protein
VLRSMILDLYDKSLSVRIAELGEEIVYGS